MEVSESPKDEALAGGACSALRCCRAGYVRLSATNIRRGHGRKTL